MDSSHDKVIQSSFCRAGRAALKLENFGKWGERLRWKREQPGRRAAVREVRVPYALPCGRMV
jgi:hypothetical protein